MSEHEHHGNQEVSSYDQIISQQSLSAADFKQHLTGPLIAFLVHLIAIPIMLTVVISEAPKETEMVEIKTPPMEEIKPPEKPPEPQEPPDEQVMVEKDVDVDRPPTEAEPTDEISPDDVIIATDDPIESPPVTMTSPNNSKLVIAGLYAGRQGGKSGRVGTGGGSSQGQRSLQLGLRWLAENQNPDGSWGKGGGGPGVGDVGPALTSLAMLSFFAHGETPSSVRYGKVVQKGCEKLIAYSKNVDGRGVVNSDQHQYSHAILTYALADGVAMTKLPQMREAMDKMVVSLIKGQNQYGSFDYNLKPGDSSDISFAGWCFQALKAAYSADCTVKGLNEALEKSIKGIKINQVGNGAFTYRADRGKATADPSRYANMTPVGVLCLQLLGQPKSDEAKKGIKFLSTGKDGAYMELDWRTGKGMTGLEYAWRVYAWYYQTQVFFQNADNNKEEPMWKKWRLNFEKSLISEQEKDGSWFSPYQKYDGPKWSFSESSKGGGQLGNPFNTQVYSTSLCVMMLEVYYRFLPASQQGKKIEANKDNSVSDEQLLEF